MSQDEIEKAQRQISLYKHIIEVCEEMEGDMESLLSEAKVTLRWGEFGNLFAIKRTMRGHLEIERSKLSELRGD